MKFVGFFAGFAACSMGQFFNWPMRQSGLVYEPQINHPDKTFWTILSKLPESKMILNSLDSMQRGKMDHMINTITALGAQAEREVQAYSQTNSVIRKNVLNFLRQQATMIVQDWCEHRGSDFCNRTATDEALNFITTRFCSRLDPEMRRRVCEPEASNPASSMAIRYY